MNTPVDKDLKRSDYIVPSIRCFNVFQELSFLASNLEPIGGGDDPDIDW